MRIFTIVFSVGALLWAAAVASAILGCDRVAVVLGCIAAALWVSLLVWQLPETHIEFTDSQFDGYQEQAPPPIGATQMLARCHCDRCGAVLDAREALRSDVPVDSDLHEFVCFQCLPRDVYVSKLKADEDWLVLAFSVSCSLGALACLLGNERACAIFLAVPAGYGAYTTARRLIAKG